MGPWLPTIPDLVSGALYAGQVGDSADPTVELDDEQAAGHLNGGLKVHQLVGDMQLMVDHLQRREKEQGHKKVEREGYNKSDQQQRREYNGNC